jgi:hypothetical protein
LGGLVSTAEAGDPCPIGLQLFEVTPEWRDRSEDLGALSSKRTWLGLTYGGNETVRVKAAVPRSPAALAGIQKGDTLVAADGVAIRDRAHLNALFDAKTETEPVTLTVERSGEKKDVALRRGPADPVFLALVQGAEGQECRSVRIGTLDEAQQKAVSAAVFDENRGFRCEDAHKGLGEAFESGDLLMVRGGRRILLTTPGWTTHCVAVADHDGEKLTKEGIAALLERLTAAYVKDRHDNP